MPKYSYVYVLRSLADRQFYVGLTKNLPARLQAHNKGLIASTRRRAPFELLYWEGCLNRSDAAQREKYLKTAWGKRYLKGRLRSYLTGKNGQGAKKLPGGAKRGVCDSCAGGGWRIEMRRITRRRCRSRRANIESPGGAA